MTKKQQTILLAIIGIVVVLVIVVVAVGAWVATSMFDNVAMNEAGATKTMDDVRARFAHAPPVLDVRPTGLTMSHRPPDTPARGQLNTLHILRWNVHEEQLSRIEIPFWLLRLRDGPIDVSYESDPGDTGLRTRTTSTVRVSEIERFGPALLVDGDMPDGGHLLIWSD